VLGGLWAILLPVIRLELWDESFIARLTKIVHNNSMIFVVIDARCRRYTNVENVTQIGFKYLERNKSKHGEKLLLRHLK